MARKPAPPGSDRRQQILDAALALFAEQGLDGATSKDIAERAEVTHGLIYFYFKSKEDLYKAAFDYGLARIIEHLDLASVLQGDEPPEQTLNEVAVRFLETVRSPAMRSLTRLMMHTMAHKDWREGPLADCKLHLQSTIGMIVRDVSEYLDRQVALGRLRPFDTKVIAKFLIGGIATSVRWAPTDGPITYDSQAMAASIVDALMSGLLTPADSLADLPDDAPQAELEAAGAAGAHE